MRCTALMAAAAASFGIASMSHAAFTLIDDFQGYVVGSDVAGQGSWTKVGIGNAATLVAVDPADAGNNILQFGSAAPIPKDTHLFNTSAGLKLLDGTSGTLFFRVRFPSLAPNINVPAGMQRFTTGDDFNHFATQVIINTGTTSVPNTTNQLKGRDGGSVTNLATVIADAWYNVWVVMDNAADTYTVHLQSDDDAAFASLTQVGGTLAFRTQSQGAFDLERFSIKPGGENFNGSPVYYDAIHFDQNGSNLTNPIPEPTTLGLMAITGALTLSRRRRNA